jgi:hypothetical protein
VILFHPAGLVSRAAAEAQRYALLNAVGLTRSSVIILRRLLSTLSVLVFVTSATAQDSRLNSKSNVIATQRITFVSVEKARPALDAYVALLQANPGMKAYVIVYGGRFECRGEANQIIRIVRSYLVDKKIEEGRLVCVNGKHRERSQIDMFLIAPGMRLPRPFYYLKQWEVREYPSRHPRCRALAALSAWIAARNTR